MDRKPKAFTLKNSAIIGQLVTPCEVSEAFDPNVATGSRPRRLRFTGLWDTGATGSMITSRVAGALGLMPSGMCQTYHAQGVSYVNTYLINIVLLNGIQVYNLKVSEGNLPDGIDLLIGMDIISLGDFSITHRNGGTTFSFQIPSTHEYDFVKQIDNGVGAQKPKKKRKR